MVQANSLSKIAIICGPTGSGKSELAVKIAEKFNGEVISADSVAIYKGLDIGSAKPKKTEMRGIPHHLIDVVTPFDEFSVSDYEKLALNAIADILSRGKLPIICGGTGFYINSVLYKLSYGNAYGNSEIREKYEKICLEKGKEYLFELLKEKDEETALKLHPNDVVRVIRALEIYDSTGVKKSAIKDEFTPRFDYIAFTIDYPREELYNRINRRVDKMIKDGLIEEVIGLLNSGVPVSAQSMQGIGYKETAEAIINGEEVDVERIKLNSRRYAKRQITFFKRYENLIHITPSEEGYKQAENKIKEFLQ